MPKTLAYLLNMYPMTSTTFIREEILAHEAAGVQVKRFAIRPWDVDLVEPADMAERRATEYILEAGAARLLGDFARALIRRPRGVLQAAAMCVRLALRGRPAKNLIYFLEAARFSSRAREEGINHVHVHFSTNAASVAMLAEMMGGPGFSMTVHGPDELAEMTETGMALKARRAQAIAAITEYCRGVVIKEAGESVSGKTHIIRCGIDPEEFVLRDLRVVPENQRLVCIGRLGEQKQQIVLPEVAAALSDDYPGLVFILLGDGDARSAIEARAAELGVERHFEFRGWAGKAAIKQELATARAMILPSRAEGLPVAIMEALAQGCPVISTRITGIPELVDKSCGWLVPPGDVPALIEAVSACLKANAESLAAMGAEGRARVLTRHDQHKNADALRCVFDTIG